MSSPNAQSSSVLPETTFQRALKIFNMATFYDGIDKIIDMTAYQGFDPEEMTNTILAANIVDNREHDIRFMISVCCERGTKTGKMKKRMNKEGSEKLREMVSMYNLQDSVGNDSKAVTLSRVCLCFSWITCDYMHTTCRKPTVSFNHMNSMMGKFTYPKCMMTSAFSSMIPRSSIGGTSRLALINALALYQLEFNKIISKGKTTTSKDEIISYIEAGMNNNYLSDSYRMQWLVQWGIFIAKTDGIHLDSNVSVAARVFMNLDVKRYTKAPASSYAGWDDDTGDRPGDVILDMDPAALRKLIKRVEDSKSRAGANYLERGPETLSSSFLKYRRRSEDDLGSEEDPAEYHSGEDQGAGYELRYPMEREKMERETERANRYLKDQQEQQELEEFNRAELKKTLVRQLEEAKEAQNDAEIVAITAEMKKFHFL